jgi:hypothetical protein
MTVFDIHEYDDPENLTPVNGGNAIYGPFSSISNTNDLDSANFIWMSFDDAVQLFSTDEGTDIRDALAPQTQHDYLFDETITEPFVDKPSSNLLDALEYPLTSSVQQGSISATTAGDLFMTAPQGETALDSSAGIEEIELFRDNPEPSAILDSYSHFPTYFEQGTISGGETIEGPMTSIRVSEIDPSTISIYQEQKEPMESGALQDISDRMSQIDIAPTSHLETLPNMPAGQMVLAFSKPKRYLLAFLTNLVRTRMNRKPVSGNNKTGRTGKFRCIACRRRRRKVQT